jgi:aminopeptidase N
VNFDRITYGKGAAVLKQLVAYVGIDAFTSALRAYFKRHAWGNTVLDDLLEALEVASGRPVRAFAAQWLQTAQVNTLHADVSIDSDGRYSAVTIRQEAPPTHPTLRTHRLAVGLFDRAGDSLRRRDRLELEVTGPLTPVPGLTGAPSADLLLLNDDDLTYAKVRLDPGSTRCLIESVAELTEPLARAVGTCAAWDLVRDSELPARDYVRFAARALPRETDLTLAATILNHVQAALTFYVDPAWAAPGWQTLADLAQAGVRSAAAGSGGQRLWAGAYAAAARAEADLSLISGWLGGEDVPDGLEVGPDLRWELLHSLVAAGAAPPAQIQAEAASDNTTRGESAVARARALIPTADAKAAAWAAITDPATASHLRRAALLGFQHPVALGFDRALRRFLLRAARGDLVVLGVHIGTVVRFARLSDPPGRIGDPGEGRSVARRGATAPTAPGRLRSARRPGAGAAGARTRRTGRGSGGPIGMLIKGILAAIQTRKHIVCP